MDQAQNGTKVRVEYTGKLRDGTVFDSNRGGELLEFTIGAGDLLPGFENTVAGMSVGETRMVSIPPEEGYGLRDESLITKIPRAKMANNAVPQVGQTLTMRRRDGEEAEVTVVAVDESTVTIDGNNPLAGQQLAFEIQLVEIVG
jgi:peptidylprolyl isomerase